MSYTGTVINESPVIVGLAGAKLAGAEFLAAVFDENGKITTASTAGATAIGILPPEEGNKSVGDTVTVQVKDISRWKAGEPFAAGDLLSTDANGKAVKATEGDFILAVALEAATAADNIISVQIIKAGYSPAE
jgi:regulator of RNase E activity RraA